MDLGRVPLVPPIVIAAGVLAAGFDSCVVLHQRLRLPVERIEPHFHGCLFRQPLNFVCLCPSRVCLTAAKKFPCYSDPRIFLLTVVGECARSTTSGLTLTHIESTILCVSTKRRPVLIQPIDTNPLQPTNSPRDSILNIQKNMHDTG